MAAVYGHVGPFDENIEKFADYAGCYEAFMVANEIAKDINSGLIHKKKTKVCLYGTIKKIGLHM